ncbi:MAG: hypothetical protein OEM97_08370 [Acidimicrobiia bacterium]|nr:hypothetical protein [Acidimicrobiia bacterium]
MSALPVRRFVFLVVLALLALAATAGSQVLPPGGTFSDDDGSVHEANIEAIAAVGITVGCAPNQFCPRDPVARGQMAAFLARALGLPPPMSDHFSDDDGTTFEDEINRVADANITLGCATGLFCPIDQVTRGQMAAFLVRAYGHSDGTGNDTFTDDDGTTFETEIDRLAAAGITAGCSSTDSSLFCPEQLVLRDQMASFIARAEGLDPIEPPPPATCTVFPADNIWNRRVDDLSLDARSDEYIASLGTDTTLHPDFGSGVYPPGSTSPIGIPFVEVGDRQADVEIVWTAYGDESDPGPYPVPANAPIEGGPDGTGDRHVIVVDTDDCELFELFSAFPQPDGSWSAASGARYDLMSHALRTDGWTSADAAGLPIYPGLVRYDEVASGRIAHAVRFTAAQTQDAYVWPARHDASSITDTSVPPMGQRFRMKAGYDISSFSTEVQVILTAFKAYGLILADNGADWFISGAPDERWDNNVLGELKTVPGSAFEAVDVSGLIVDPDSGQVSG